MKGITKQHKQAARFGPKWWNRNDHISTWTPWDGWHTWGFDEFHRDFEWPRPARCCVEAVPEQGATKVETRDD